MPLHYYPCHLYFYILVLLWNANFNNVRACNSGSSSSTFARADQALYMRHMMQLLKDTVPDAAAAAPTNAPPQYDYGTDYYYATDGGASPAPTTAATPNVQTPPTTNVPQPPTPAIQPTMQPPPVAPTYNPNQVVYPPPPVGNQGQNTNWHYNEVQVRPYPSSYPCCPNMLPSNPCCQSITVQVQMNNFCTLPQNCAIYG